MPASAAGQAYTYTYMLLIKHYLLYGFVISMTCLIICSVLSPQYLLAKDEGGISNFGNHVITVIPYVIFFLSSIVSIAVAALEIKKQYIRPNKLVNTLLLICLLELFVLVSTFLRRYGWTYSLIHDYLGVALFAAEFLCSLWIIAEQRRLVAYSIFILQGIGLVIALLSVSGFLTKLFIGQVMASVGFGLLLVVVLPDFIDQEYDLRACSESNTTF